MNHYQRIDDLAVSLSTDDQGRDRLLTVHPITRRASLSVFVGGRQVSTIMGRIKSGYPITDKTLPNGRRWIRLAMMLTLAMWVGGCTMQADIQAVWPGKYNTVSTYDTQPARTVYHSTGVDAWDRASVR